MPGQRACTGTTTCTAHQAATIATRTPVCRQLGTVILQHCCPIWQLQQVLQVASDLRSCTPIHPHFRSRYHPAEEQQLGCHLRLIRVPPALADQLTSMPNQKPEVSILTTTDLISGEAEPVFRRINLKSWKRSSRRVTIRT